MFGNQIVTYGGSGGIRRGLIWQGGEKREKDYITGHLVDVAGRFLGYYPYGEVHWMKERAYQSDPWRNFGPWGLSGKHPYVKDGALYMGNWERFNICHIDNSVPADERYAVKNAGFVPIYPQWGGDDPEQTPFMNQWSQDPVNKKNLLYLPSVNKILARREFTYPYQGFSSVVIEEDKAGRYDEDWIYGYSGASWYSGLFSDVSGGFIQASKFSKDVYLVRNGRTYTSGGMGYCEFRIAKEVDLFFFSTNYFWYRLIDIPIPTALIALDD